ncbi:MAG: carbonic anhydrase [Candidatus Eremiobacteraeota bacterium]|nr:carbonic anhydrase [Candidatus Eremiobacteraeota bacterium]
MQPKPTTTDELVQNAAGHPLQFDPTLPVSPSKRVAIVACMDSRIDIFGLFGLGGGEAHVIRNAGGIITSDVLRSLVISQRLLGTREIILVHHTDCGLQRVREHEFRAEIAGEVGAEPPYAFGAFSDLELAVRSALAKVREHAFLPYRTAVRGFVYDVTTGGLREIQHTLP